MDDNSYLSEAIGKLSIAPSAAPITPSRGASIQCYENSIPPFAERELERLYANIFSSLAHCRVHGHTRHTSTYVAYEGKDIVTLWLFQRRGSEVRVFNEGICISDTEVERFTDYIFTVYPDVALITFHAVQTQVNKLSRPFQRFNCLEDMVVTLPKSAPEYKANLGKSTRAYINRYLNKFKRDFPSFRFETYSIEAVREHMVRELIELNRVRMALKGRVSNNDSETSTRIMELAKTRGHVCVVILDGKIIAGTINYQSGDNYFLELIAHDPAFNDYRLGMLCCYLTISECIARGGKEYHLLWGQDEYKQRLTAVQRDLDHLSVYRSRHAMLVHGDMLLKNVRDAGLRRAQLWLRHARKEGTLTARLALATWRGIRVICNSRRS